jgi:signal transduction histidine kinase
VLSIADGGVVFDLAQKCDGLSLRSMRERVDAVGCRLEVCAQPGVGTRVTARVPSCLTV